MKSSASWRHNREQRTQFSRVRSRIAIWRATPHFQQMAEVSQQPAAHDSATEMIEFGLKSLHSIGKISGAEIRSTGDDDTRRLPFGVRVDDFDPRLLHHGVYRNANVEVGSS